MNNSKPTLMPKHSRDKDGTIICFDVETTGLPPPGGLKEPFELWPHIVQLSWIKYCPDSQEVCTMRDLIVDPKVTIPPSACDIHGITNEKAEKEGVSIREALHQFFLDCDGCCTVVAHNLNFDMRMVHAECTRHKLENTLTPIPCRVCTMKSNIQRCKIEKRSRKGNVYYKYPRLIELHEHLFGRGEYRLHDALVDCILCLRCYLHIEHGLDIIRLKKFRLALQ